MSEARQWRPARAAWGVAAVCVAIGVGSIVYRLLHTAQLNQSAALFVGLPGLMACLAAVVALKLHAQSATGIIFKMLTIALLVSAPLLGEGFVCILFAAPLFYAIGALVGVVIDFGRRRSASQRRGPTALMLLLPLLVLSLEGAVPGLEFPRQASSAMERVIEARPSEVEAALSATPRFVSPLPPLLNVGFPRPIDAQGAGLALGDRRAIGFGRPTGNGADLVMEVVDRGPDWVRFRAVADQSKIADWLGWQTAEVAWSDAGGGRTRVRWVLSYERRLDPVWYFGPWQSLATTAAADYLISTAATPPG